MTNNESVNEILLEIELSYIYHYVNQYVERLEDKCEILDCLKRVGKLTNKPVNDEAYKLMLSVEEAQ